MQKQITDDLEAFIEVLPPPIIQSLSHRDGNHTLLEVVLDLGRPPEARYPGYEAVLSLKEIAQEDIDYVISRLGDFGDDNRAGIERTLHRISAIRNRKGRIVGLTCRVGRAVFGTIRIIEDLVKSGKNILLLGRPGVGKTTMLREVARVLADDLEKRVIIVDTSNEIAGDGDIPHPAIGHARRMQVPTPTMQHAVMIEGVENHMPEVIIIDEIGTEMEAAAARTIAERGVQLVGTAHGNTLENLMMNPTLSDLVGGIQSVTLGDEEARRRGTQKSILERKAPPTFDVVVEIQEWDRVAIHTDVAEAVDLILRGQPVRVETRSLEGSGEVRQEPGSPMLLSKNASGSPLALAAKDNPIKVYPYGVNRYRLTQAVKNTRLPIGIIERLEDADGLITLRTYFRRKPQLLRDAEGAGIPTYVLRSNTIAQMEQCLTSLYQRAHPSDPISQALKEAENGAKLAAQNQRVVELNPQRSYIRRLQHQLAEQYGLASKSAGREPLRRVRLFPKGGQ